MRSVEYIVFSFSWKVSNSDHLLRCSCIKTLRVTFKENPHLRKLLRVPLWIWQTRGIGEGGDFKIAQKLTKKSPPPQFSRGGRPFPPPYKPPMHWQTVKKVLFHYIYTNISTFHLEVQKWGLERILNNRMMFNI